MLACASCRNHFAKAGLLTSVRKLVKTFFKPLFFFTAMSFMTLLRIFHLNYKCAGETESDNMLAGLGFPTRPGLILEVIHSN